MRATDPSKSLFSASETMPLLPRHPHILQVPGSADYSAGVEEKYSKWQFANFTGEAKNFRISQKNLCDESKLTYSQGKADVGCLCTSSSKYCLLFWLNRAICHLELFIEDTTQSQ